MTSFVERTNALTAKLNTILEAKTTTDWSQRLARLKDELVEWRREFLQLPKPLSQDSLDAVESYTATLTEVLAMKAAFLDTAPAAGGRRKYTRRYCKKTPCRKMGFTQKASCRPYKNCYLTRS
jgi:hypothetical protein